MIENVKFIMEVVSNFAIGIASGFAIIWGNWKLLLKALKVWKKHKAKAAFSAELYKRYLKELKFEKEEKDE